MARSVAALLAALDCEPQMVVGHSAGAAILARLCLDGTITPKLFVSLNGAFLPFEGAARYLFPSMAKLLFLNPLAPRLFAWAADKAAVANLLQAERARRSGGAASISTGGFSAVPAMSPARSA